MQLINEAFLEKDMCYCLLNDNKTILPGCRNYDDEWVHPYILLRIDDTFANNLTEIFSLPEMLVWAYKNVPDTRTELETAVSILNYGNHMTFEELNSWAEENPDYEYLAECFYTEDVPEVFAEITQAVTPWTERTGSEFEDALMVANDTLNNSILRARIGGRYRDEGDTDSVYFRVSSVGFDWYDAIVNFIDKKNFDGWITIEYDPQALNTNNAIVTDLPVLEFIEDEPLVESAKKHLYQSALEAAMCEKLSRGIAPKDTAKHYKHMFERIKQRAIMLNLY